MLAVIGGSGFEKFEGFEVRELLDRKTPFGEASSGLKKVNLGGKEIIFLSRHGDHHEHLPSEINYRANIFALKRHGAKAIISFSAIGSLAKELKPGDLVIPSQYIDRTKGIRASSFLGGGLVGHVSLAHPVCSFMTEQTKSILKNHNFTTHFSKTYVCIEGPFFSTQMESKSYQQMGADVIGMSNFPEYALAREAGMAYLPCCWVTDYDCWDDSIPHVTVGEIISLMRENNKKAFSLLKDLVDLGDKLWSGTVAPSGGLRTSLFMPPEAIPKHMTNWLEVLMS